MLEGRAHVGRLVQVLERCIGLEVLADARILQGRTGARLVVIQASKHLDDVEPCAE